VISGVIFLGIKTGKIEATDEERQPILESNDPVMINTTVEGVAKVDNIPPSTKVTLRMRIIGCVLALVSGILFGLVFTPSTYIQDHIKDKYPTASRNGLHYIFSMYTGILLASFVYYSIYIIAKRNRPYIYIESVLPAFLSGIMWGIAQAGFLVANSVLSQAISFPLISIGPGAVAALWSILYFKDIAGKRNYLIFVVGTLLRVIAAIFIILSKPISNN
jgi:ABC-type amino acid transport system permease subunit